MIARAGELLDQIEYTVGQSVNYTGKAIEELRTANKYQKKTRRKMCCIICVILVVLAVVLIPIITSSQDRARRLLEVDPELSW